MNHYPLMALILFCLSCSASNQVIYNIRNFNPKLMDRISPWTESESGITERFSSTSPRVWIKKRFNSYVDHLLDVKLNYKSLYIRENSFSDSLYEAVRMAMLQGHHDFVPQLKRYIENGVLNVGPFELWLILERLVADYKLKHSFILPELIDLVLQLTEDLHCSPEEDDVKLYVLKFETLKKVIIADLAPEIIRPLVKNLKGQLTEEHFQNIIDLIIRILEEQGGLIPANFQSLIAVVEELNPVKCFSYIFDDNSSNYFPLWITLCPFYLLFKHVDTNVMDPLLKLLEPRVFKICIINSLIISEFIRMTNFNSSYLWSHGNLWQRRAELLRFILGRFEIAPAEYGKTFLNNVVPYNLVALAESFLFFLPSEINDTSLIYQALRLTFISCLPEMAVVIAIYSSTSSGELYEIFISSPDPIRISMKYPFMDSIKVLLEIVEQFDEENSDIAEKIVERADGKTLIKHLFSEPKNYESNSFRLSSSFEINANWVARIILLRSFGFSFVSTRIRGDGDSVPIWREIADDVNFFLYMACKNCSKEHQVETSKFLFMY